MTTIDRIKIEAKAKKISISKLEKECGFANGYIGQLKKGTMPAERLNLVADYLGVSSNKLMGIEPDDKSLETEDIIYAMKFQKLNKEQKTVIMNMIDQLLAL